MLILTILFTIGFTVSAQTDVTRRIAEFGFFSCEEMSPRLDNLISEMVKTNQSETALIVIYEGKYKGRNPTRGNAMNRLKEIRNYLTYQRMEFPEPRYVFINGGFRENFTVELWLIPEKSKLPKLSPTLTEKEMRFRKGKPLQVRNCEM